WNVNAMGLKGVERLFCKNERVVLRATLADARRVTIVLVAAVLVACVRLRFLDAPLDLRHRGPNVFACDAAFRKGDEMGWFEQGSTAIVFAPPDCTLCERVAEGATIRMGEPLMRMP